MKRLFDLSIIIILTLILPPIADAAGAVKVPHEVGGFALGSDVSQYPHAMQTNFMKDMVVTDWHGFRKGVISYGVCKFHDTILKISLKYADPSEDYFEELLEQYKKRFGNPQEWKGDSFGILRIWKWNFVDSHNRAVSLLLQHNLRDPSESIGNLVKLSYPEMIEEERLCFNKMCEKKKSKEGRKKMEEQMKPDKHYLIPR